MGTETGGALMRRFAHTNKGDCVMAIPPITKERIMAMAQRDANNSGESIAVLNLNQFSPLYVCRRWDDRYQDDRRLIVKVDPETVS
jgi:hypothetical protein